ncbi:cell wall / vacuolar inhibitor of fructosidase 2 [Ricinus communis]|uniref:Pectinesterase inhibitor, putative n=1 Tax=Ricinus communis TaxID=3988 RepID=B9RU29_RICCO|nr:cell wall / vacuolar inhibitor of fructosidase 2 [Ricinus communis]EEF45148.1 Pectinesterase inhibitor, putative [Ricinus communis]|eukprot:XP_002517248.1 cell wall / vacuolar inhibitor of fructosidase 2 [Ricinus communis]
MDSTIFLFLLLSLAFPHYIFNHQLLIFVNGDMGLIQQTCKNTKHYDLCVSTLKSNATSSKADTKGLALIMVAAGVANATDTSSYLSSQLLRATNDTILKKVLKECADKYGYAGDSLQDSVQDLTGETYDYAYIHIMAAADYPNACHNSFRRVPGLAYPQEIARREQGLEHICDVVLGIVDVLVY